MASKPTRLHIEWETDEAGYTRPVDPEAFPKRFYALAYTWRKFRVYRTKGAAEKGLKAWKRLHESAGYDVLGSITKGYVAVGNLHRVGAATVHEYRGGRRV